MAGLTAGELTRWRVHSLGLGRPARDEPVDVVRHLLGVQSQDHGPATWSVGQRLARPAVARVDEAFAAGDFVRAHVLRPTWHFVCAADLRWLQRLTAPRVERGNATAYREEGWDAATLARALDVVQAVLDGAVALTRDQIAAALQHAGIGATGRRLGYLLMHGELSGLICSGPPAGRQHTHRLLTEGPDGPDGDEALAELGRRYAASHGPVTPHDLASWATLTVGQARQALAGLPAVDVEGTPHLHAPDQELPPAGAQWHLLQTYDELVAGYRSSKHLLGDAVATYGRASADPTGVILWDGRLAGRWRRRIGKQLVDVEVKLQDRPGALPAGLRAEVIRFAAFLGRESRLTVLA